MQFFRNFKNIGPGSLVTAAFIGPGTITTCSLAGANFGMALLWGLLFSIIATLILQEMTARLGIITQQGLGDAIRNLIQNPVLKILSVVLIISAITIGNAAYETGNLIGAAMGIDTVLPEEHIKAISLIIGLAAFVLLWLGSYRILEKVLIGLVILMSLVFLTTAIVIAPHFQSIIKGIFIPSFPGGSALMLIGLIGTTIVPYNLFLHTSVVKERWKTKEDLPKARFDLFISIILGGIISMSIVITSAMAFYATNHEIKGASDMAIQLEPILGSWAKYILASGLFAAGISSSITAPLAAAYATSGILGWKSTMKDWRFKLVWMIILGIGILFSSLDYKPIEAIWFAQITNGILLPVIATFLVLVMNNKKLLGDKINKPLANVAGIFVIIITLALGLRSILSVTGII
ncbi:Nramp family divalent metal transporter [Carboxylicivirga caseinilyticus]|uniref:Nramp family divalent metal transporter n=1 Tax=Carboxylicivirga caseinilyticus TaxID=3417572 RepID=UPI003D348A3A|nr:Nramp family divalent metal transporter [Marinilabiliaceae bacterium A049]